MSKDYYTNKNILRNYTDYDDYLREGVNKILDDIVTKDLFNSFEEVKKHFLKMVKYDFEEEKEYIKSIDLDNYEFELKDDKKISEKEIEILLKEKNKNNNFEKEL